MSTTVHSPAADSVGGPFRTKAELIQAIETALNVRHPQTTLLETLKRIASTNVYVWTDGEGKAL